MDNQDCSWRGKYYKATHITGILVPGIGTNGITLVQMASISTHFK